MGRSCQNWMNQVSQLAIVLTCTLAILLPYTSAYALHNRDLSAYKNKRDELSAPEGIRFGSGLSASEGRRYGSGGLHLSCQISPRNCPIFRKRNRPSETLFKLRPSTIEDVRDVEDDTSREESRGPHQQDRLRNSLLEVLSPLQSYETEDKSEQWK